MTSTTFFFIFIPLLAIILLAVNLIFAPHNPYEEKDSTFECGFHSFLGQNRTQFSISFFIFALLFLLFDLEILLVYPYVVSAYANGVYGLMVMLIFFLALTLGFAFELGKNALKIDSRQMITVIDSKNSSILVNISGFKSVFKYFTMEKIIAGLISLSIIIILRYWLYGGFSTNPLKISEAFTIGVPAIFLRLGIQGLVDWIFQDLGLKTLISNIFNKPSGENNTMIIGSTSSPEHNKPWKMLYNAMDSDKESSESSASNSNPESNPESNNDPESPKSNSPQDSGTDNPGNSTPGLSPAGSLSGDEIYTHFELSEVPRWPDQGTDLDSDEEYINDLEEDISPEDLNEFARTKREYVSERLGESEGHLEESEIYKKAVETLDKAVEERTAEELENLEEAKRECTDEVQNGPERVLRRILYNENYLRAVCYARRAEYKADIAQKQLETATDRLKALLEKLESETSEAINENKESGTSEAIDENKESGTVGLNPNDSESTTVADSKDSDTLNKRKRDLDSDDSDGNDNSKRTKA